MGSILGQVIPKTTKMVPIASLLTMYSELDLGALDRPMIPERGTTDAHHSLSYGSNEGDKFCILLGFDNQ